MYESQENVITTAGAAAKQEPVGINLLIRLNIKYILKLLVLWLVPITIASLLAGISSYFLVSKYRAKTYMARTLMLRYEKGVTRAGDVPYLYPEINLNTLLETVKLPQNLEAVINRLGLDMSNSELFDIITVEPGNRSNTIHIFVHHTDPELTAKIANTISEVYIEAYARIFNSAAAQIYDYYKAQRDIVLKDVREAEVELHAFRDKVGLFMADEELKLKLKQLSDTELKLEEERLLRRGNISKIEDIKGKIELLPDTIKISETLTSQREKEKLFLERELELMSQRYTESHPEIKDLKLKIAQLDQELKISETSKNLPDTETFARNPLKESLIFELNQLESEVKSSDEIIAAYSGVLEGFRSQLKSLSEVQDQYYNLKQRVDISRDLLDIVEKRIADARIAKGAISHDLAILERADVPLMPEATGRRLLAIISVFGMAFICLVFIMAYAIFSPGVKVPTDLDTLDAVEFVGVLPKKRNSTLATYFSTLQVVVNRIDDHFSKTHPTLICVTSLKSKEGKSTIIDDIVDMKANSGKKVLILKRVREEQYNRDVQVPANSIVDFTKIREDNIERPKPVELSKNTARLYYLVDRNISKLNIGSEVVDNFVNSYNEYDYIFIEVFTPRRNFQVTSTIMRQADYNLLVTRYGKNTVGAIDKVTKNVVHGTKRKIGTVINCGDLTLV